MDPMPLMALQGPAAPNQANTPAPAATPPRDPEALRETAIGLEAHFLAEMLRSAGLHRPPGDFSGGAGEDQFASFMVREQADQLARAGGIGLAEHLVRWLAARDEAS